MFLVHEIKQIAEFLEKFWLQNVKTKWHPPEGIFSKSPEDIANVFAKASSSLRQAMSRLNFAQNRAGWCDPKSKHYNADLCKRIQAAKEILRKKFVA